MEGREGAGLLRRPESCALSKPCAAHAVRSAPAPHHPPTLPPRPCRHVQLSIAFPELHLPPVPLKELKAAAEQLGGTLGERWAALQASAQQAGEQGLSILQAAGKSATAGLQEASQAAAKQASAATDAVAKQASGATDAVAKQAAAAADSAKQLAVAKK